MANMYLEGNFAPVQQELTAFDLEVTGTIPDFLDGRYVRNGPNPIGEVDPQTYHWFMGDGMVHGVRLAEGNARWYRNRWVRVSDPANPPKHRAGIELFGANTNVIGHAGKTLALIEGGMANYELDEELDTVGPCDFDGTLPGGYTAHPHRDPVTGELHAITHFFGRGDIVQYSVIDVQGRARRIVDIPIRGVPMMHDFSLTQKYVVLYDLPVTFDPQAAAAMTMPRPLRYPTQLLLSALIGRVRVPDPITAMVGRRMRPNDRLPARWNPVHPARVGLLPREGTAADIRWFDVSPCYVFHPLNAYDDGDTVVLDVVRHPRMFVTDRNGPDEGPTTLDRWVVDPRPARSANHAWTTAHRSSRASTNDSSGASTATATPWKRSAAAARPVHCSNTIWSRAPRSRSGSAPVSSRASSASSRVAPTRPRTRACSWATSSTRPPAAATC